MLVPAASAVVSLLIVAGTALASSASNTNTGAESTNEATVTIKNNVTINSTNNANISNNIFVKANTGYNSANQNTGSGSITTGDISGSVSVKNTGNENAVAASQINLCCENQNFSSSNKNTGASSKNKAEVKVKNNTDINANNKAGVENDVGADLNTGGNEASKNTGNGIIITGDINFGISIINELNQNIIGGPLPGQPEPVPGPKPPMPTISPLRPGQVLGEQAGLPVTGGSLLLWPVLLAIAGATLKLFEKTLKIRLTN